MAQAVKGKKRKKKKRSQAPVALVYFITLLLFLGVFGVFAKVIVDKLSNDEPEEVDYSDTYIDSYNTLYLGVNGENMLGDLSVWRVCPEKSKILIVPMSVFTVSDDNAGKNFQEIYTESGVRALQTAVEKTFGISIDYYVTVSNTAFEECADIVGGFFYAPEEELYQLSENSNYDISLRANKAVTLTGRQIIVLCRSNIFSKGRQGNVEFLGAALVGMINQAFEQVELTSSSLDIMYGKLSTNSSTSLSENDYKQHRAYIKSMLEKNIQPAYSMIPEGTWLDDYHFEVSAEFKQKLYDEMEATKSEQKSGNITPAE